MVVNGSAHDELLATFPPEALPGALSRIADLVRDMRATDESAGEVLSRLGRARLARLLLGGASDA